MNMLVAYSSAVDHLVEFYCDRLRDRVSILPQVFYGLQALVSVYGCLWTTSPRECVWVSVDYKPW